MFLSHERRRRDRFIWAKLTSLLVGGVVGLIGMRSDNTLLVDIAIGLILVGFALRFLPHEATLPGDRSTRSESDPRYQRPGT
jgi:hypothetical protein